MAIATPEQLKTLTQAVDDYCRDCCIADPTERFHVSTVVSALFERDVTKLNDLRRGLEEELGHPAGR